LKFIFPQNYQFQTKLFGLVDYGTAIFDIVYTILVFSILNFLFSSFQIKLSLLIIFVLPVFIISLTGFYRDSIISVLCYITKFIVNRKIYFYEKN